MSQEVKKVTIQIEVHTGCEPAELNALTQKLAQHVKDQCGPLVDAFFFVDDVEGQ